MLHRRLADVPLSPDRSRASPRPTHLTSQASTALRCLCEPVKPCDANRARRRRRNRSIPPTPRHAGPNTRAKPVGRTDSMSTSMSPVTSSLCGGEVGRPESARKFSYEDAPAPVSGEVAPLCKSVGVCLRRFEPCTRHPAPRALDRPLTSGNADQGPICQRKRGSGADLLCPALSGWHRRSTADRGEYAAKFGRRPRPAPSLFQPPRGLGPKPFS